MRHAFAALLLFASTPVAAASTAVALKNATVWTVAKDAPEKATIVIQDGKIVAVGPDVKIPSGATVLDLTGRQVTPGFIDVHSHMGVYPWPGVEANSDGNEATDPITPQVRALDSFWFEDPALYRASAGGITAIQVLPGSANLIGGQAAHFKVKPGKTLDDMIFKGVPRVMKMALGENPKRVYGERKQMPSTRMGNIALLRETFTKAREYKKKWDDFAKKPKADQEKDGPPDKDLKMEALAGILSGEIHPHVHCYRQDEILRIFDVAQEFGFKIAALHHCLEGYKVAKEIASHGAGVATWPDWYGFKVEAFDGNPWAYRILLDRGVVAAIKSDSADTVQRFNLEAAKTLRYGLTEAEAMRLITLNPAKLLAVDARVGTIEAGKDADLVVFDGSPFSTFSHVEMTFVDGEVAYRRSPGARHERSGLEATFFPGLM